MCLLAAGHQVILVDSLIQEKVMPGMGIIRAVGRKEVMTFVLFLHIFRVGISFVILVTHVGGVLKIILVVNL